MGVIYRIRNIINNKFYIGSTKNFSQRKSAHLSLLRRHIHDNGRLQNAWNKYCEDNFVFEIIEEVEDLREKLIEREQYYFDTLNPNDEKNGYNLCLKALSNSLKGKKFSIEHKKKLSIALKGRVFTQTHRENLSKSLKGKYIGENNPFYGKKHTQESKNKIRAHASTLTQEDVNEIRSKYEYRKYSHRKLAREYNVAKSTIQRIIHRKVWIEIDNN